MVTAPITNTNMVQAPLVAPQQQCIVGMLVPADQLQAYFPGATVLPCVAGQVVPAVACDAALPMCQVASFQMQAPVLFQPTQQMQPIHHIVAHCGQMPQLMCNDIDTSDACSQPSARTRATMCSESEELQSKPAKLTASAARRQRRKRAAERLAQSGVPAAPEQRSAVATSLSREEGEQLRLQLSEGKSQDFKDAISALQVVAWCSSPSIVLTSVKLHS
eukprot:TRINITY_DN6968_c0_g2_i2.p2 TRINITY_DN6968_c0_g2~~TRINITY_DN6968_c0_g2_i2.p2  ORF type:complete len:219 (+),score=59.33 TRINITY_DN6968_c0_g2_i2:74-730(+)